MSSSKLQILVFLMIGFFSFIYLYTMPSDLTELDAQIQQLNLDTKIGQQKIDQLETALVDLEHVVPRTNVSYVVFIIIYDPLQQWKSRK